MFTPSHRGISTNAYADAVAKAHLAADKEEGSAQEIRNRVKSRSCIYSTYSDFNDDGVLYQGEEKQEERKEVIWDRRLFPAARKRIARWMHSEMIQGLSGKQIIDKTFIGRRGHMCETKTYAEILKLGVQSEKLDRNEEEPVERMARDTARVSIVMTAKKVKHEVRGPTGPIVRTGR